MKSTEKLTLKRIMYYLHLPRPGKLRMPDPKESTFIMLFIGALLIVIAGFLRTTNYQLSSAAQLIVTPEPSSSTPFTKISYNSSKNLFSINPKGIQSSTGVNPATETLIGQPKSGLFSATISTHLSKGGYSVYDDLNHIKLTLKPQFSTATGKKVGKRLIYPIGQGNSEQVVYTPGPAQLAEDIVVNKFVAKSLEFKYSLSLPTGLYAKSLSSGAIGIFKSNQTNATPLFDLPTPVIKESNGFLGGKSIASVATTLSGSTITVKASNLDHLTYPIAIDPTVVVGSANNFLLGNNEGDITNSGSQISQAGLTGGSASSSWSTSTNSFTTPRLGAATTTYDGYVYEVGGCSAGNEPTCTTTLNDVQYASLGSGGNLGTWASATSTGFTNTRYGLSAVAYDGYLYIMGGRNGSSYYNDVQYAPIHSDGTLGSWKTATSFTNGRWNLSVVAYEGYLYILGGYDGTNYYNDVQYAPIHSDGSLGTWQYTYNSASSSTFSGGFTTGRYGEGAVAYNGNLYVMGGCTSGVCSGFANDVQYAPLNSNGTVGSWSTTTSFPTARDEFGYTVYDGYLYIMGGYSGSIQQDVEYAPIYANGSIGNWQASTNMPQTVEAGSAISYDNYLYFLGGYTPTLSNSIYYDAIDSAGNTTSYTTDSASPLPLALDQATSAVYKGYIYEIGGYNGSASVASVYFAQIGSSGALINNLSSCPSGGTLYSGTWCTTTSLPQITDSASTVIYNGYIYEIGGYSTSRQATVYYAQINSDGTLGSWTSTTALPNPLGGATATVFDGYIYELAGYDGSYQSAVYSAPINSDGSLGSWTATTTLPQPLHDASTVINGDYIYELDGNNTSGLQSTVYYAQITSGGTIGSWVSTTAFPQAFEMASAVVNNGYIYSFGGYTGSYLNNVYYAPIKSDGSLGSWSSAPSLPQSLRYTTSAENNGYFYVLGGDNGSVQTANYYTQVNNGGSGGLQAWNSSSSNVPQQQASAASAVYNGYVYELGGINASNTIATVSYNSLANNGTMGTSWTTTTSLPQPISAGTAVAYNGYLYMLGGYNSSGTPQSTVYFAQIGSSGALINNLSSCPSGGTLYSGTWCTTTSLTTAVAGAGTVVYNGNIYEVGGWTGSAPSVSSTYYASINSNGTLSSWNSTTSLSQGADISGTVEYDGYIYVIGGTNDGSTPIDTAYYTKINSNGTLGSWVPTTAPPIPLAWAPAVTYDGYIYLIGGYTTGNNAQTSVFYASINTNGSLGNWSTTSYFTNARWSESAAAYNGNLYIWGGEESTTTTTPGSQNFTYSGSTQTYTVPSGVSSLTVDMTGGGGGSNTYSQGGPGGAGARVQGNISVTQGESLTIYVAGAGVSNSSASISGGAGGYGYGTGGAGGSTVTIADGGGGGGGSSAIVTSGGSLLAAAAGGGGGSQGYTGGAGGGTTGVSGSNASGTPATGGTQTGPGTGGSGGSSNGGNGSGANGGYGAGSNGVGGYVGGGGGGGGYYGGGGGNNDVGSSGAGGSSYIPTGGTATTGYESSNGYVDISYSQVSTSTSYYSDVQSAAIKSIARVGQFSTLLELGNANVTPDAIVTNGSNIGNPGLGGISDGSMSGLGGITVQYYNASTLCNTLGGNRYVDSASPEELGTAYKFVVSSDGCGNATNQAQYVWVHYALDDSQTATFPDINSNHTTITGFQVFFHPATSMRLRGGMTFVNGSPTGFDTPPTASQ